MFPAFEGLHNNIKFVIIGCTQRKLFKGERETEYNTCYNIAVLFHCFIQPLVFIGASRSKPHHMGLTVKSVFLLACLLDTSKFLYMAESRLSANQHYIKHYKHYIKHVEC